MSSEGSPSPKSGRMRNMTRRASSMLGISSRSLTPAPQSSHKDSSSASDTSFLRRSSIDHQSFDNPTGAASTPASSSLTAATSVPEHAMPIPIPESPARETADSEEVARVQGRIEAPGTSLHQAVAATNGMQSPSLRAAEAPTPESRQHTRVPEASQMSGYIISDDDVGRDNQPTPEGSTQLLENYFTTITSEMVNFVSGDFHNTTNNNNQQITGSYNTENHNIINSYNDTVTGSVDDFSFINQRMAEMYAEKSQAGESTCLLLKVCRLKEEPDQTNDGMRVLLQNNP
ncbi:hypothetical protein VKT23_001258 [Stygiomarasmius scandens]|uniref:Uncharacterized protein n=1 Tax=Marasmiellus scandens TaxID=2682957 RepID=A0ABR1K6J7_9AGAR